MLKQSPSFWARNILALLLLGLLAYLTMPLWQFHLHQLLDPRGVGAIDEGIIVDSTYHLALFPNRFLEFHSKGQLFFYWHAFLYNILHPSEISFDHIGLLVRSMNLVYFFLTLFLGQLLLNYYLSTKGIRQHLAICLCSTLITFLLFVDLVVKSHVEMLLGLCCLIAWVLIEFRRIVPFFFAIIFYGMAMHLKLNSLLLMPFLMLLSWNFGQDELHTQSPSWTKKTSIISLGLLPAMMTLSAHLTNLLTPPYVQSKGPFLQTLLLILSAIGLLFLALSLYLGPKLSLPQWFKSLSIPTLFFSLSLHCYMFITTFIAFGSPFANHAFGRPLSLSFHIANEEGIKRGLQERFVHRAELMQEALEVPLTLLFYIFAILTFVYFFFHLWRRWNHPIKRFELVRGPMPPLLHVALLASFFLLTHLLLNKMTLRYFIPFTPLLLLVFLFPINLFRPLGRPIGALAPIILLLLAGTPVLLEHPFWNRQGTGFAQEVLTQFEDNIRASLQELGITDDELIWAGKHIYMPKNYKQVELVGESNRSYFYGADTFPRPLWNRLPKALVLGRGELEDLCQGKGKCELKQIMSKSLLPDKDQRIYSHSPEITKSHIGKDIDLNRVYTLNRSIGEHVFIFTY